jgi:hypothetical protein
MRTLFHYLGPFSPWGAGISGALAVLAISVCALIALPPIIVLFRATILPLVRWWWMLWVGPN